MEHKDNLIQSSKQEKAVTLCDSFHGTIEFIGKRWTGIIIYHLLSGPKRYHELVAEIHGVSDRLLTERLRELESQGLVIKNVSESSPRKVEYELTQIGQELEETINSILKWVKVNGCHTGSDNK